MISENEINISEKFTLKSEADFEKLFRTYFAELAVYAFRFTEDSENAEEIVQDIFFNIWSKRENLQINISIKSYLYQTVKNSCLNFIKHKKVEDKYKTHFIQQIQYEELNETDLESENLLAEKIQTAIDKMPPARKKVFLMSKIDNLKYKEIAETLGISIKTVENHIGNALKFLREELTDFLPFLIFFLF
jgi:RNA polymerase sigma-70 factor (ECF subfamily)